MAQTTTLPTIPKVILASLQNVRISSYTAGIPNGPITALPLNAPPIDGFVPRVVYGLTNQHNNSNEEAVPSTSIGLPSLPSGGQKFYTAIVDSGAQSHIISYADTTASRFNLNGANLIGENPTEVSGVSGDEVVDITKPLGLYASGFGSASVNGSGTISAGTTVFGGHYNVSAVSARADSPLPSVVGAPMMAQYKTTILNTQPQHLTVGTQTFRSPQVEFGPLSASAPAGYGTFSLTRAPTGFLSLITTPPSYFPGDLFGSEDPITPTSWYSLLASANLSHTGGTQTGKKLLFDTGAQVSVVSVQLAADLGYSGTPDFEVVVDGVGGTTSVGGFYLDSMSISTAGAGLGSINWHHVPILVINLPNPDALNTGQDYLDGVMGMNLFTDRNIVLNGTPSFVGITQQWQWNNASGGSWGSPSNWTLATPSGMDTQANFYSTITTPKTVIVDGAGYTVGTINFDNTNKYTLNGPGRITMQVSTEQAQINVSTGSHTINAPMTFANDTLLRVWPAAGRLTISSDVTATGVNIIKQGPGTVEMKNVRSGSLTLNDGTLQITANAGTNGTSRVSSLLIETTLAAAAHLDLTNNSLIIDYPSTSPLPTIRQYLANGYAGGAWNGNNGINSSLANSNAYALGSAEKSLLGVGSFGGQTIAGSAVLVKYTYYGDTNLDGLVNITDLYNLALHWNTSNVWTGGDFNYDDLVNIADLRLLAMNWQIGNTVPLGSPSLSAALASLGLPNVEVPEPSTTLLSLAFVSLARRSRSRRQRV